MIIVYSAKNKQEMKNKHVFAGKQRNAESVRNMNDISTAGSLSVYAAEKTDDPNTPPPPPPASGFEFKKREQEDFPVLFPFPSSFSVLAIFL